MNKLFIFCLMSISSSTFASGGIFTWGGKIPTPEKPENIVVFNGELHWDAYGDRHAHTVQQVQELPHQLELVKKSEAVISVSLNI